VFLMNELRLNARRAVLKDILENAVPATPQDVVLIFCTVSGWKDGRLVQLTDARKIYHGRAWART
jgi:saccharopine dehydrogenase-like NADP-dependent oxidoreductase